MGTKSERNQEMSTNWNKANERDTLGANNLYIFTLSIVTCVLTTKRLSLLVIFISNWTLALAYYNSKFNEKKSKSKENSGVPLEVRAPSPPVSITRPSSRYCQATSLLATEVVV